MLRENKKVLYERHNYNPKDQTKNIHHIVFQRDGGTDTLDNLALLDVELHDWIHQLIERMEQ